jgi:hypothetical protein
MLDTTREQELGSEAKATRTSYARPENWPKRGTKAKLAWLGTLRTAKKHGKGANLSRLFAQFVAQITKPFIPKGHVSAGEIVRLRRYASVGVPVYDLTVDQHHCYVANGMLVSNCDSVRYLFVGYRPVEDDWGQPLRRGLKGVL